MTATEYVLNLEQLQERCHWWQRLLRLQDWEIDLRLVRTSEMGDQGNAGECHSFMLKKKAVVLILCAEDARLALAPSIFRPALDMEYTLVHELLHLAFNPITLTTVKRDSQEAVAEEQAIDALASAYVKLYRGYGLAAPQAVPVADQFPVGGNGFPYSPLVRGGTGPDTSGHFRPFDGPVAPAVFGRPLSLVADRKSDTDVQTLESIDTQPLNV
jgi:hypothetical protein